MDNATICQKYNFALPWSKKTGAGASPGQPTVLIFDNFKAQCTEELLNSNKIDVVLVPPNCTDHLQPLDVSISKAAKRISPQEVSRVVCKASLFPIAAKSQDPASRFALEYC